MYIIYDLKIRVDDKNVLKDFMNYFQKVLCKYDEDQYVNKEKIYQKFKPLYFLLLSEDDPFYIEDAEEMKLCKEFYIYDYDLQECELKISVFMIFKNNSDNDIFESWLLHISRQYPLLHIYLYYYHIYYNDLSSLYDDDVLYVYIHQNRMIESREVFMDDYYLQKYGKEILNQGFYILYPIYKELICHDPNYYKNYEHRFYKILSDPYLMYESSSSNKEYLFEHMMNPKYKHYRPLFYKFKDFLDTHTAIRDMIIDETTRMIGKYKEDPLIHFQCKVKHKLRLKKIHQQLYMISILPPLSKEELIYLKYDKICFIQNIFLKGGAYFLNY